MKFIFFTVPAQSHLNPTLGVVKELLEQGHTCIVYNTDDHAKKITDTGAEFRSYGIQLNQIQTGLGKNPLTLIEVLISTAEHLVPQFLKDIEKEKPDCIIHDSLNVWGKIIAAATHIPAVSFSPTFGITLSVRLANITYLLDDYWKVVSHPIKTIIAVQKYSALYISYHLTPPLVTDSFANKEKLNIIFTSKYFQPDGDTFDSSYQFVGPIIYDRKDTTQFTFQHSKNPVIYISLGTIYNADLNFYRNWIKFFTDTPYEVYLSVGKNVEISSLGTIPTNIVVQNFLPQLQILSHTSLFISHAGMNSVSESLFYGVPMLMFPQMHEQRINARRVERLGAGIYQRQQFEPIQMKQTIETLINNSSYKENATKIGNTLREAGGAKKAVDVILNFLDTSIKKTT